MCIRIIFYIYYIAIKITYSSGVNNSIISNIHYIVKLTTAYLAIFIDSSKMSSSRLNLWIQTSSTTKKALSHINQRCADSSMLLTLCLCSVHNFPYHLFYSVLLPDCIEMQSNTLGNGEYYVPYHTQSINLNIVLVPHNSINIILSAH